MELVWQTYAWEDYLYWQQNDKKVLGRINDLIKDTLRNPFKGIGKPDPVGRGFTGADVIDVRIQTWQRIGFQIGNCFGKQLDKRIINILCLIVLRLEQFDPFERF